MYEYFRSQSWLKNVFLGYRFSLSLFIFLSLLSHHAWPPYKHLIVITSSPIAIHIVIVKVINVNTVTKRNISRRQIKRPCHTDNCVYAFWDSQTCFFLLSLRYFFGWIFSLFNSFFFVFLFIAVVNDIQKMTEEKNVDRKILHIKIFLTKNFFPEFVAWMKLVDECDWWLEIRSWIFVCLRNVCFPLSDINFNTWRTNARICQKVKVVENEFVFLAFEGSLWSLFMAGNL
jgi:hypothetical protein